MQKSNNIFRTLYIIVAILLLSSSSILAQGLTCGLAEPFCADGTGAFYFENNSDAGQAEPGPNYGCLGQTPNPAWFFLQIDQAGNLNFNIVQSSNTDFTTGDIDVDFIAYGPFPNTNVCNQLTAANTVACSFSPAPVENFTIPNAQVGEIYVLLITNYDNQPGFIQLQQTNLGGGGAGSTDCSIVNADSYCEGEVVDLNATTAGAVTYEWFQDGNPLAETGPILTNVVAPSAVYTTNAIDNLGAIITTFEFVINFETQPVSNAVPDMLQCDGDNNGFYLFNLESQTAQILGGLDPVEFPVTYHLSQTDADSNLNAITSPFENTSNPQTIYARVENSKLTDCFDTTSFIIQVFDTPTANVVPDQEVCDDNNDGEWSFDLVGLTPFVLGTQSAAQYKVSFHLSQSDADGDLNGLISPYQNVSNPQIIYTRIENVDNEDCYDTSSFVLEVFDSPIANPVADQLICDDDNDGFWPLDLNALSTIVLGTQNTADFTVSYHLSQAEADANSNAIASPYTNVAAYVQEEIFIRIENNNNTSCYDTSSFLFDVFDQPTAENVIYDLCDDATDGDDTNGFVNFDLASITPQVLGTQNPLQFNVTYHLNQADANANVSALTLNYVNATANSQQIAVRVENIDNTDCYETAVIDLVVYELPTTTPVVELFQCDDDADGFVSFNLTEANELISANYLNEIFSYYTTLADAQNAVNAIANPIAYTNTDPSANPDVLYVRTENTDGCYRVSQLELLVSTTAVPPAFQLYYEVCDDTTIDGDDRNGIATFDFSNAETQIRNLFPVGQSLTITYYETLNDALAETNAIADISNHRNDASPNVQNIYVRIDSDIDNACLGLGHHITLTVNPVPEVIAVTDFIVCEDNTDGFFDFDLESKTSEVLNGQDPATFVVTYHETQADADTNTAALVSPYTNLTNPQQIFVRITNAVTGCFKSVVSFNIEVQEEVQANQNMPIFELCDEFGENDGFAEFDLRSQDALVLDGQDPADYSVSYHLTQLDADLAVNPLPDVYQNITNPQTIYARVSDVTITNSVCWATTEITLQVNLLPIFDLDDEYLLCLDTNGTEVVEIPILDTQLSDADYTFEWRLDGALLFTETSSSLTPSEGGTYSVLVTNNVTGCQNTDSALVNVSSPPTVTAEVTSLMFANNHVVEVTATGLGISDYEYSLDNGAWQDSNIFEHVSLGVHIITVRDKNGCGLATTSVLVIDYPLYFTPNGDGYNDTWNIAGIATQPDAVVYIFDRFGKLLKQLSPTGNGWNGTYNGVNLPTNDYWFSVEYNEPINGKRKEFRAHFTLKR
jgi:gliding motility-associated-like protein